MTTIDEANAAVAKARQHLSEAAKALQPLLEDDVIPWRLTIRTNSTEKHGFIGNLDKGFTLGLEVSRTTTETL